MRGFDDCLAISLEGSHCGEALQNNPLQHLLGAIIIAPNELLRLLKRGAGAMAIMVSQSFNALPAGRRKKNKFFCMYSLPLPLSFKSLCSICSLS